MKNEKVSKETIKLYIKKLKPDEETIRSLALAGKTRIDLLSKEDLILLEKEAIEFLFKNEGTIKKLNGVEMIINIGENTIIRLDESEIWYFIDKKTLRLIEEKLKEETIKFLEAIKINIKELKTDEKKDLKELRDLLVRLWLHLIELSKINKKKADELSVEFLINQGLTDDITAVLMMRLKTRQKSRFQDMKMFEKDFTEIFKLFNPYLMCKIHYGKKKDILMLLKFVEEVRTEMVKDVKQA